MQGKYIHYGLLCIFKRYSYLPRNIFRDFHLGNSNVYSRFMASLVPVVESVLASWSFFFSSTCHAPVIFLAKISMIIQPLLDCGLQTSHNINCLAGNRKHQPLALLLLRLRLPTRSFSGRHTKRKTVQCPVCPFWAPVNMAVHHGDLHGRGPVTYVDINSSF